MVRGLDLFRERFRLFQGMITLIGGAACDEWFTTNGMNFRATDDLDLEFPPDSADWPAILASLRNTIPGTFRPADLSEAIQTYFGIVR